MVPVRKSKRSVRKSKRSVRKPKRSVRKPKRSVRKPKRSVRKPKRSIRKPIFKNIFKSDIIRMNKKELQEYHDSNKKIVDKYFEKRITI
jgi:hypothetical protein